jgi:hypothetical protein
MLHYLNRAVARTDTLYRKERFHIMRMNKEQPKELPLIFRLNQNLALYRSLGLRQSDQVTLIVDAKFGLAGSTRDCFHMAVATCHDNATTYDHTLTADIRETVRQLGLVRFTNDTEMLSRL